MYILLSYLCYTSLVPGTECKAIAIPVYQVRTSLTLWKSDRMSGGCMYLVFIIHGFNELRTQFFFLFHSVNTGKLG